MRATAEVALRRQRTDGEYREALGQTLTELDRTSTLVENLLLLARADSGAGGMHFQPVDLAEMNGSASVRVTDSGIGIAEDDLPHIFDRFYRADKARSRETGGAGLGLSITRWIVETHNGEIQVESALGRGSTFCVALPLPARAK